MEHFTSFPDSAPILSPEDGFGTSRWAVLVDIPFQSPSQSAIPSQKRCKFLAPEWDKIQRMNDTSGNSLGDMCNGHHTLGISWLTFSEILVFVVYRSHNWVRKILGQWHEQKQREVISLTEKLNVHWLNAMHYSRLLGSTDKEQEDIRRHPVIVEKTAEWPTRIPGVVNSMGPICLWQSLCLRQSLHHPITQANLIICKA